MIPESIHLWSRFVPGTLTGDNGRPEAPFPDTDTHQP